jgi:transcriptional regulator with XRE-family HTH domain
MPRKVKPGREAFRREAGIAFSANLKRLRDANDLSQEDLSIRASLIRNHVGKIEKGNLFPEMDTIYRLAGALEIEPSELLAGIYWQPDDSEAEGHFTDVPPKPKTKTTD